MAVVKNLMVRAGADFSELTKATVKAQNNMRSMQKSVSSSTNKMQKSIGTLKRTFVSLGVVVSATAITKFAKDSVNAAVELENALAGLDSILTGQGKSFEEAKSFVQDFIKDGLVPAAEAATAYKNLAARGYSTEQIEQVMTALKDSAAYGRQASYSMGQAVKSATEGLKNENSILVDNAGVTKNVSQMWADYAKQIGVGTKSLTKEQKILAEVNGILEETRWQVGDASKLSQTYSGQVAQLSYNFQTLKANVGTGLMSALTPIIGVLNTILKKLTAVAEVFSQVLGKVFGKQAVGSIGATTESTEEAAEAQENLANKLGESGKEAKRSQASFDDLNILQGEKSSGSGSGSTGNMGLAMETVEGESEITRATNNITSTYEEMAERISSSLLKLKNKIEENKAIIIATITAIGSALASIGFISIISKVIATITKLGGIAGIVGKSMSAIGTAFALILSPAGLVVGAIAAIVGIMVYLYQTNETVRNAINTAFNSIVQVFSQLGALFSQLWTDILAPVFTQLMGAIRMLWDNGLRELCTQAGVLLASLVTTFAQIFTEVIKILSGVITFITGVFTGDFGMAWEGVTQILRSGWNAIVGIIESGCNLIISAVNAVIGQLNKIKVSVPSWVKDLTGMQDFGISIRPLDNITIPRLAKGGIATSSTLANIGEAGREAVLPLDNNTGWMDIIATKLASAIGNPSVTFEGDLASLGRLLQPVIEKESARRGTRLINGVI